MRFIGFISAARSLAPGDQASVMSVSKAPGSTRLARTFGAQAPARPSVIAFKPALAIAYGRSDHSGRHDPAVETLMIEPPSPSAMRVPMSAHSRNGPLALTACTLS